MSDFILPPFTHEIKKHLDVAVIEPGPAALKASSEVGIHYTTAYRASCGHLRNFYLFNQKPLLSLWKAATIKLGGQPVEQDETINRGAIAVSFCA